MVIWEADKELSSATDLYSHEEGYQTVDEVQNYETNFTYNGTHVLFQSDRALDTGDPEDFIIHLVTFPGFYLIHDNMDDMFKPERR